MLHKIKTFWANLNLFEGKDPDTARRGRVLNILLAGSVILSVIMLAIVVAMATAMSEWGKTDTVLFVITLAVLILGGLGLLKLNQFSVKYTSFLFLAMLMLSLMFSDTPQEVANGRSSYVFFIPIAISSLLLTPLSSFFFAAAGGASILLLAGSAGETPNVAAIISGFVLAIASWLSASSLEKALQDLRAINLNLDRLVEQKTRDLAETLSRELVLAGRNQAILDSITDGVIVFDEKQTSILANPALSQMTGILLKDLRGIQAAEFVKSKGLSSASQGVIIGVIEQPENLREGVRLEWGDRTLFLSTARVQDAEKHASFGSVAVFRDITKEAEIEKMKENFVAVVSHELRTPLNAIMGYAEMLQELFYGPLTEKQSMALERIIVNTNRMFLMVGDLLDEAQIKAGKLSIKNENFQLGDLTKNLYAVIDKLAADKGIDFAVELAPDMPQTMLGDQQRLQQIIVNLASNAIKFTERGGVRVKILRSGAGQWQIQVSDTGAGIPESELPHIFKMFHQVEAAAKRRHGGFGLGLAIVKQLTELMNGTIAVESELGKGSVFKVTLPLLQK